MTRIENQKHVIKKMIELFCKKNHDNQGVLCNECNELLNYAYKKLDNCIFGTNKPNCNSCKIHCYKSDIKEKITAVMKFSGPRMLIYNPKLVIEHFIDEFKYRKSKR